MLIRAAVTVVFLCVGMLLLSACGLPMLIPPRQLELYGASLVLWDVTHGSSPTNLGILRLSGPTNHLEASLLLKQPGCPGDLQLYLTGSVVKSRPPHLSLTQKPGQPDSIQLQADLPQQPMVYSIDLAPASGSFSLDSGCASGRMFPFQARELPDVLGYWQGSTPPPQVGAITEAIGAQSRAGNAAQATIEFQRNSCFRKGETASPVDLPTVPQHFTFAFEMDSGAVLTAETTVDVLSRHTPLITHYSIAGGACDGQSFTATLHHD